MRVVSWSSAILEHIMAYPSRRGIYYLRKRTPERGGWYIFIRHRPPGELNRKKIGNPLAKYFDKLDLPINQKTLNDKNCMAVVEMIRAEIDDKPASNAEPSTEIAKAVGEYLDWKKTEGRSVQHIHTTRLRMLAGLGLGKKPRKSRLPWKRVADVNRKTFQQYLVARRKEVSVGECNHEIRAWRPFCSWLVDTDVIEANPLAGMKEFTDKPKPQRVLSLDELERFFAACQREKTTQRKGNRAYPVRGSPNWIYRAVFIDAHTGMRPAELSRLTWEDSIDLAGRRITVRRKRGGVWSIPMSELLAEYLELTPKDDRKGPVIPGFPYREDRATPGGYHETIKRAATKAGMPDVTFMTLRRSVATHLANAGESMSRLQAIMGWETPAMAMRYVKLAALDTRGATDRLPWGKTPAQIGNKVAGSKGRASRDGEKRTG